MEQFLKDKVAVVTGGTRGIGRSISSYLLRHGATVVLCGRDQEASQTAAAQLVQEAGGQAFGRRADVSNWDDVADLFRFADETAGGVDILVNNAGIGVFSPVADLQPEDFRRVVETNLTGAYYCSHLAIPRMKARGGGYILNISSLAGKNPFAGGGAYNASKFALNGFSEAMMMDHRHDGIRVSYIMPGSVATEFGMSEASGWMIAPEDIAELVIVLLRMPQRTLVSRVEVRPTKPQKK